jgi:hypothetical protein
MANGYIAPPKHVGWITNMHRYAPFIGLAVVVAFCFAAWFLAPKGENQT